MDQVKERLDRLTICAFLIYAVQYITFKEFLDTNITILLILFGIIFFMYLLYSFYFIFKINSSKEKIWKHYKAARAGMFLLVFVGLCMYFISSNIHLEVERTVNELIRENKGRTSYYDQIVQKEYLYKYLGNLPLGIGFLGIIYFLTEAEY